MICGWSSEARVFASIASSVTGTEVRVLPDRSNMLTSDYKVTFHRRGEEPTCITSRPPIVKHNAEDAMKDVDIVVFILPFSAHEGFLEALRPYIKPGVIIVGLPGEPGFEFQVLEALGDVGQQCTIMNFESSPWVCRNAELGVDCEVLSTKETLLGAMKVSISLLSTIVLVSCNRYNVKKGRGCLRVRKLSENVDSHSSKHTMV